MRLAGFVLLPVSREVAPTSCGFRERLVLSCAAVITTVAAVCGLWFVSGLFSENTQAGIIRTTREAFLLQASGRAGRMGWVM